jgi:hypothetical protein
MILAAAAAQPARSWAGLLALAAAYVVFRVGTYVWTNIKSPSPPPAIEGVRRVKVQATVGVTPDEPTADPAEVGWWGRIREVGGVRFRQAQQVVKTGSHELPAEDEAEPEGDTEVDLALDDEPAEGDDDGEAVEEYIARARKLRVPYSQIVRVVVELYGVSESTAKRRIRDVDDARRGQSAA